MPAGHRSKNTRSPQQQVNDRIKEARALEMRTKGSTYQQIADALGYKTRDGAQKCVMRGLEGITLEPAKSVLKLELERLDIMIRGLMKNGAATGDHLKVTAAVRVMERRARYLGLDKPDKMQLTGANGEPIVPQTPHDILLAKLAGIASRLDAARPEESGDPPADGSGGDPTPV